jgi:LytS/YehU family sensor histidine kinase
MRFGEGISMNISVPEAAQQAGIPPLTLQMLVENAVKHNQVSLRKPLHIAVFIENEQWVVVQNNVQLKRNTHSNGMGLSNIAAKFRLLNQEGLQIINDNAYFTIKVPLIKVPVV